MPRYRVEGISHADRHEVVIVEAADEVEARNVATRSLRSAQRVQRLEDADASDFPEDRLVARSVRSPGAVRPLRESELLRRPVRTIAAGVFTGLLAWTIFALILGFLLSACS